jgi:hypothetical protein
MPIPDFIREIAGIGVVRSGFQQQHGNMRVCDQSAGQHTSGCAAADHHVIFHVVPANDRGFSGPPAAIVSSFQGCRKQRRP